MSITFLKMQNVQWYFLPLNTMWFVLCLLIEQEAVLIGILSSCAWTRVSYYEVMSAPWYSLEQLRISTNILLTFTLTSTYLSTLEKQRASCWLHFNLDRLQAIINFQLLLFYGKEGRYIIFFIIAFRVALLEVLFSLVICIVPIPSQNYPGAFVLGFGACQKSDGLTAASIPKNTSDQILI